MRQIDIVERENHRNAATEIAKGIAGAHELLEYLHVAKHANDVAVDISIGDREEWLAVSKLVALLNEYVKRNDLLNLKELDQELVDDFADWAKGFEG